MGKINSSIEEEPNDSFTSMIDIVFLLLIFFILQPFKQPEMKLRSELPKDEGPSFSPPDKPRPHIVIKIEPDPDNKGEANIFVDGTMLKSIDNSTDNISEVLKQRNGGDLETPIALMPNLNISFKYVLKALDECYEVNMAKVKFEGPALDGYVPGKDGRLK